MNSGLCSFTFQVQTPLDLLRNLSRTNTYKNDFQLLPEELDEKVTTLHLPPFSGGLTVFTQEHADSTVSKVCGTSEGEHYRC